MATEGTPAEGLQEIGDRYVGPAAVDLVLVAYHNAGDSLDDATVLADLTLPTVENGYAPIVLDGTWDTTNGILTYTHSSTLVDANPSLTGWAASGTWTAGAVNGVAILAQSGSPLAPTEVVHFHDLDAPFTAAAGKKLGIDLVTVL